VDEKGKAEDQVIGGKGELQKWKKRRKILGGKKTEKDSGRAQGIPGERGGSSRKNDISKKDP